MLTSKKNNRTIEKSNDKLLELMNDRGKIESYLLSPLPKITNPQKTSQYKLVKGSNSNRVNDLSIHISIQITLYNNLLKFRESGKEFELIGDLLKMITNRNYNVDLASLTDQNLKYGFAK